MVFQLPQEENINERLAMSYLEKAREAEKQATALKQAAYLPGHRHSCQDYLEAARSAEEQAKMYRKCADLAWLF